MAAKQSQIQTKDKSSVLLSVPFYTQKGNEGKAFNLPKEIFGQKANEKLIAQAVRVYLSNQREACAKVKTRAEVNRTTKKLYRQKGTGGARHGSRKAPIFVGGGVAHGPTGLENYKLKLPKKMARRALFSALSAKVKDGKVAICDIEKIQPKTKELADFLSKIGISYATIVHGGAKNLILAGRNLNNIDLVRAEELNTYDVLRSHNLLFTKEGLEALTKRKYA
jgi:large subunit ribosomal protein L4